MSAETASQADWLHAVEGVLKGASFAETLETVTADGIHLAPLYPRRKDAVPIAGRPPGAGWDIVQRIDHPDVEAANRLLIEDLEGGAAGVTLVTPESPFARGFGTAPRDVADLDRLLRDVRLDIISLRLDAGARTPEWARWLEEHPHACVHFGYDPVGMLAAGGALPDRWEDTAMSLARLANNGTALAADGRVVHEAGATPAMELASILSSGLAYLRALEQGGLALEDAAPRIGFVMPGDQDFFVTLAKCRALRLLWRQVETACGLPPRPIHLHAETSWRMLSRRDPATNILRNGLAAAAAGLGGADSIAVLPFTSVNGLPDAHARRVARNCQHVLMQEAGLHRIADPAAGAGGLEALTSGLCDAAWTLFQRIEKQGGLVSALRSGWVGQEIEQRRQPVGTIVGTNQFTLAAETPAAVLRSLPPRPGACPAPALPRHRDAEPFEDVP